MLKISPSVMVAFEAKAYSEFITRARRLLRQIAPHDVAKFDDANLEQFVRDSADVGAMHGVSSERGIVKWTLLRIIAGPSFHMMPAVAELFRDKSDSERALTILFDRLAHIAQLQAR